MSDTNSRLIVREETTGVEYPAVRYLVFPDGSLTPERGGKVHVAGGGGGTAGRIEVTKTAGATISGHRAVKIVAGLAQYADKDDLFAAESVLGITTNSALIGEDLVVVTFGEIQEGSWAWTQNLPIYLGDTGLLTQTPPLVGAAVELGIAIASDTILVRIQKSIFLL